MFRLKFLRITRGLRQAQVATRLGIPRPHVSQIENGMRNPTARQLATLARIFNCPADTLMEHVVDAEVPRG